MKRFALSLICLVVVNHTAWTQLKEVRLNEAISAKPELMPVMLPGPGGASAVMPFIPGQKLLEDQTVGTTWYDLQSYSTVQKRIYAFDDGSVGATYMRANDVSTWNERGSAYNYFDGNSWGPNPTGRIESVRTGWPCYAPYGPNGEIVVSHSVIQSMGLVFNKRDIKGEGAWEEFSLPGPEGWDIVWPAMVTNGPDHMNIHVLAVTYGDPYADMTNALLYYRSNDGGQTWNIQHMLMDELNSNYFNGIGGDNYSWAAPQGDTLAFSVGFSTQDGYIMKSYDNGTTWTQVIAYDSPYTPYTGEATPTFCGGDGTQACAIDAQGNVHVVFGRMWHYYDDTGAGFYYPSTEGLVYWNETMPTLDTTSMSTITLDYLIEGGNLIGWVIPKGEDSTLIGYGTYSVSLTSHPQMNIDDYGNIHVVWSAPAVGFDNTEMNYRHIFTNSSTDGGATWTGIKDMTTDLMYIFSECVYPVMSPSFTGDKLYMTFLTDGLPGIHIWIGGHDPVENWLMFQERDIEELIVGVDEHRAKSEGLRVEVFPNPFEDDIYLTVGLYDGKKVGGGDIHVKVMDLQGRVMMDKSFGRDLIQIDGSSWTPGVYILQATMDGRTGTVKLVRQ